MLVGPVFSAGSVTSERERQTLDLLLTTLITPWQMLWGKLISGLRVSSVLTFVPHVAGCACVRYAARLLEQPAHHGRLLFGSYCRLRHYGDDGTFLFYDLP